MHIIILLKVVSGYDGFRFIDKPNLMLTELHFNQSVHVLLVTTAF
jgi:hypothetical protein